MLAEALNGSKLTLRPGSFVDESLNQQHTDLLYSATLRDRGTALLYLLFEHQSSIPTQGLMAHRLLRYQDRIWDRWSADHPKHKTLPMIIPIVLYHGEAPWSESLSFEDLLDVPADLRPAIEHHLVRFTYVLYDLAKISDDELRKGAMSELGKLVLMCFKHARTAVDFLEVFTRWADVAREVMAAPNGLQALVPVMRYILEVNPRIPRSTLATLAEREIGPEAKEAVMTAGQQLIEQGRQQGVEQSCHVVQDLLLSVLQQRFGAQVDAHVEQRISAASFGQLQRWSKRVMSVPTLTELFND
jgi:predicted transposase/invertase (TIGR01784 family)